MMVDCKIYKGIEYVETGELPLIQREKLIETINKDLFIKIMIDGRIVSDCLQFKDYAYWFNNVYKVRDVKVHTSETLKSGGVIAKQQLVLNN